MTTKYLSFYSDARKLEEELGSENLDDSRNQALCEKTETARNKVDSIITGLMRNEKSDIATDWLMALSKKRSSSEQAEKVPANNIGNRSLTDKVLSTTRCPVEQTLNSRPLSAITDNPKDPTALTPNHFMLRRTRVDPFAIQLPLSWSESFIKNGSILRRQDLE